MQPTVESSEKKSLGTIEERSKSRSKVTSRASDPKDLLSQWFLLPPSSKPPRIFKYIIYRKPDTGFFVNALVVGKPGITHYRCVLQMIYFLMIFTKDNGAPWRRICPHISDSVWITHFGGFLFKCQDFQSRWQFWGRWGCSRMDIEISNCFHRCCQTKANQRQSPTLLTL